MTYYNISIDVLNSKTKKREVVIPRQVAMYFCRKYTKESLKNIAWAIGQKDHATCIHSCSTVSDLIDSNTGFRNTMTELNLFFINEIKSKTYHITDADRKEAWEYMLFELVKRLCKEKQGASKIIKLYNTPSFKRKVN